MVLTTLAPWWKTCCAIVCWLSSGKMASGFKQDLPPDGGYRPISWERIPVRKLFSGYQIIAGYLVITTGALWLYKLNFNRIRREKLEANDAKLALHPLMAAERDREYLRQIIKNRKEEAELMKNVKGWQVGTLYGEPIYKTVPRTLWVDVTSEDYYAHTGPNEQGKKQNLALWY